MLHFIYMFSKIFFVDCTIQLWSAILKCLNMSIFDVIHLYVLLITNAPPDDTDLLGRINKFWSFEPLYLNVMASVEKGRRILWMVLLSCLAISHLMCLRNQAMSKKSDKGEKPQDLLQRLIICTVASVLASAWVYKVIETKQVTLDKIHHGERGILQ